MGERPFVAGVDSSTQSCKVVVWDPVSGEVVREGRAPHPEGTEVDPRAWWDALNEAVAAAGGLDDVQALSVGGQQHGMVVMRDETGSADGDTEREQDKIKTVWHLDLEAPHNLLA